jgi:hypothetical protein
VTRDLLAERVAQGWIESEAAAELDDTIELLTELVELGAVSEAFADDLVVAMAQEQAELWLEKHALAPVAPGIH